MSESIQVIQSDHSESTPVIQSALAEETESTEVMQSALPEETVSADVIQPVDSKKAEPSKIQQKEISEKVNSCKVIPHSFLDPNCRTKAQSSLSDSKLAQLPTNNINLYVPEDVSKEIEENLSDDAKVDEKASSSLPVALDTDDFFSLLDTEEYNDAKLIMIPGNGQVIIKQTMQCKPIFPDFVMPELMEPIEPLSPTKDLGNGQVTVQCKPIFPDFVMPKLMEPIKHLSPTKDCIATKDSCDDKSLYTLLSMFEQWMQTVSEKISLWHPSAQDFIEYSKGELSRGLYILENMNKRVKNLLDAVVGLPDPTSFLESELGNVKISIRYAVIEAGVKVQQKLKLVVAETDKNYKMFVNICPDNSMIWAKKFKKLLLNFFNELSEEYQTFSNEVGNFRRHIRDFCFEIEKLM